MDHRTSASECEELDRLATAAAALDYTEPMEGADINDSTSATLIEPILSHVGHYEPSREQEFVNLRPYQHQQIDVDSHAFSEIQQLPCSRLVVVPLDAAHSLNNSFQLGRPVTHFTLADMNCTDEQQDDLVLPEEAHINICENDSIISLSTNDVLIQKSPEIVRIQKPSTSTANTSKSTNSSGRTAGKRKIKKPITFGDDEANGESKLSPPAPQYDASGNKYFVCETCKQAFATEELWKQHQSEHITAKRQGLSLELKIEIIKRINAGEKKHDMADEYSVNYATIKSIIKKSEEYLACWKKGMFNPDSKRLKRPKREDVEQALYSWYTQSLENDIPVSGTILCAKAVDFAHKLGHFDFKATHGWLDRFKKRKKIAFGRGGSKRKIRDDIKASNEIKTQELQGSLLPQVLIDFESVDIFAIEHVGLFHGALPTMIQELREQKCPGGVKAKSRLSVVMCTNMTGTEKFPLLIVGKSTKLNCYKSTKLFQFVSNENSWLTSEIIWSWLLDIDSWFSQQSRKVIILVPSLPIYARTINFRSIKLLIIPSGSSSPLFHLVVPTFKGLYRKFYLEEIVSNFRKEGCLDVYQVTLPVALQLLSRSWQSIAESMIVSGFQRIGLAKYGLWGMMSSVDNSTLHGADEVFGTVAQAMGWNEEDLTMQDFTNFDNGLQVCNLLGDEDILAKVTGIPEIETDSEGENITENISENIDQTLKPTFNEVEAALGGLRKYIQYQEGAQEMFQVLAQLEYIVYKALPEQMPAAASVSNTQKHY